MLSYHQSTFDLLKIEPQTSSKAISLLNKFEQVYGLLLPASIREWYSLTEACDILRKYGNQDPPIELEELECIQLSEYPRNLPDFGTEKIMPIMHENQGVCTWAVVLSEVDDPPVIVEFNSVWMPHADRFSTFVYTRVWDWDEARRSCSLGAQDVNLNRNDIEFLQENFEEGPRTYSWPGKTNYRFSDDQTRIIIWDEEEQADWYIFSQSAEALLKTAKCVWQCGKLKDTLHDLDDCGRKVLRTLRR
ncbi:MAG TPA: hypothetical protein VEC93_22050 [Anaerolineae bacterium]|nr:hypothetical protein [Anaerolineae bacterium]